MLGVEVGQLLFTVRAGSRDKEVEMDLDLRLETALRSCRSSLGQTAPLVGRPRTKTCSVLNPKDNNISLSWQCVIDAIEARVSIIPCRSIDRSSSLLCTACRSLQRERLDYAA